MGYPCAGYIAFPPFTWIVWINVEKDMADVYMAQDASGPISIQILHVGIQFGE